MRKNPETGKYIFTDEEVEDEFYKIGITMCHPSRIQEIIADRLKVLEDRHMAGKEG